ncbi:hypothetical protein [Agaribacterium haliotis]|uniref:hypothetical protein n=1 Tax=Agaribacterium haliotis TaxID=2013869 RepID=UPI000BB57B48|nr:hypothetical protein [Agaribacterium haliotis]
MDTKASINEAISILNPLLQALEAGFWDSSQLEVKDRVFDLVSCVNAELNELAKLSVSDLDLPYEPITPNFVESCRKFQILGENLEAWFLRTSTSAELKARLPQAAALLTRCHL